MTYEEKLQEAEAIMRSALKLGKPIVAYSGGKDGAVVAHLVNKAVQGVDMICELSYYFPEQIEDVRLFAKEQNWNVHWTDSLSKDWLANNPKFLFASDAAIRSRSFSIRHQKAMKKKALEIGATVTFTGRRTEENFVPKAIYDTKKNGWQCHPLRRWREADIWRYFKENDMRIPWIYSTPFAPLSGNSPFYSLSKKLLGNDLDKCWDIIRRTSPRQTFDQIKFIEK